MKEYKKTYYFKIQNKIEIISDYNNIDEALDGICKAINNESKYIVEVRENRVIFINLKDVSLIDIEEIGDLDNENN